MKAGIGCSVFCRDSSLLPVTPRTGSCRNPRSEAGASMEVARASSEAAVASSGAAIAATGTAAAALGVPVAGTGTTCVGSEAPGAAVEAASVAREGLQMLGAARPRRGQGRCCRCFD